MSEERKVRAVLNIGGEISSTLKSSVNLVTGNISKIGTLANKAIKGQLGAAIASANKEAKILTNEIRRTGDASGSLKMKLDAVNASLQRAKGLSSAYAFSGKAAGNFARGLAVVTAEATAAGWAMYHLTEKYDEHVMASRNGGKVLSLSAQSFAEFHSAAGKFADPTEKAFKMFQGNMSTGNKKTFSALQAIGIDPNSLKGTTNLEAFFRVAEKLKVMADKGQSVTGVARSIMGRGGADALPFLLKGRTEIQRLMELAKASGLAPTKEDEAEVVEYAKSMTAAKMAVQGMSLSIGHAFEPVVKRLGETFSQFVVEHGPEVRKWMDDLGHAIEKHLPTVNDLESAFHSLGSAVKWASEHTTTMKFILGAIVALPFLPFLGSLGSLTTALITLTPVLFSVASGLGAITLAIGPEILAVAALTGSLTALGFAIKDVHDNWGTWTDLDAWKGMGKNLLGMDIAPNIDPQDAARIKAMNARQSGMRGGGSPDPSSLFRAPSPSAGATKNYNPVFHFNVTAAPGMDTHAVADMVMNKLDGRMTAMASGALFD
jgi:hypothetical protein